MTGLQPTRLRQLAFGYTQEDLRVLIAPMATTGAEPIGSMGNDNALAVLSDRRPPLFSYFKQLFAQVTNPPIDPIRENDRHVAGDRHRRRAQPARRDARARPQAHPRPADPAQPRARDAAHGPRRDLPRAHAGHHVADQRTAPRGMRKALAKLCDDAHDAVAAGVSVLILSDRQVGPQRVAIPSLLAVAAVHEHLVREGTRLQTGLVLESGEPREVHHMATLDRLRLRGDQPVPAARHRRRDGRRGPHPEASTTPTRPSATSSRRSARAC